MKKEHFFLLIDRLWYFNFYYVKCNKSWNPNFLEGVKKDPDLTSIPDYIERPPYINNKEVIPESPVIWTYDQICKVKLN